MFRHPPGNNQRVVALFLALGHHDALINKLHRAYQTRWKTMGDTLKQHFPGWAKSPGFGGTSYWVAGPSDLNANELNRRAMEDGIIIEPGEVFFDNPEGNAKTFPPRLFIDPERTHRARAGASGQHRQNDGMKIFSSLPVFLFSKSPRN